jgi:hypothetical protein
MVRGKAASPSRTVGDTSVKSTDEMREARKVAARLAARTDIRDVRLLKSSAEIMRLPVAEPVLTYDLTSEAAVEYQPGRESFVVRGVYHLSISADPVPSDEEAERDLSVAKIEFEHAALFVIDKGADDPPEAEELNAYAISTGQFALYPYVREYISDITGRLGLPPLTVGVLRMSLPNPDGETTS